VYLHSKKKRFCARRLVLLISLLVGLLFSGGEGITLLPFPDLKTDSNASNFQPLSPLRTGHIAVDNNDGAVQLKIQSRSGSHQIGGSGSVGLSRRTECLFRSGIANSSEYSVAGTIWLLESINGRAPPVPGSS
jgi:hypothetical protein